MSLTQNKYYFITNLAYCTWETMKLGKTDMNFSVICPDALTNVSLPRVLSVARLSLKK